MFLGTYRTAIDDRLRLVLPEKWRAELASGLVLTRGPDRCLLIFPYSGFLTLAQRIEALGLEGGDARLWTRFLSGQATDVEMDKQGRIPITEALRGFAELGDTASLVGTLNRIEVWNPGKYDELDRERVPEIAHVAERLHGLLRGPTTLPN